MKYPSLYILPELEEEYEAARRVITNVRTRSDLIRTNVIPELIQNRVSAQTAYWKLHQAECGNQVRLTTAWPIQVPRGKEHICGEGKAIKIGQRREHDLFQNHAWHVDVDDLPQLERRFFAAVDSMDVKNEVDFIRKLTAIHAILILAHFPEDVAGRTTEDFIVYLSQLHGYPLTISANGYRGHMDRLNLKKANDNVQAVRNTQWQLYTDIVFDLDQGQAGFYVLRFQDWIHRTDIGSLMESVEERMRESLWLFVDFRVKFFREAVILNITSTANTLVEAVNGHDEAWSHLCMHIPALLKLNYHNDYHRYLEYSTFSKEEGDHMDSVLAMTGLNPVVHMKWNKQSGKYRYWEKRTQEAVAWIHANMTR